MSEEKTIVVVFCKLCKPNRKINRNYLAQHVIREHFDELFFMKEYTTQTVLG